MGLHLKILTNGHQHRRNTENEEVYVSVNAHPRIKK